MVQRITILTIFLLTIVFSTRAWADEDYEDVFTSNGISYGVNHDRKTVTVIESDKSSIVIPQRVAYKGKTYTVTAIADYAFAKCYYSTTDSDSILSRGGGLTSITIPNSVVTIGEGAFAECSGLTSIQIEKGNPNYDSRDNCNAIIETGTNSLVAGCKNTAFPNSVTSIGKYAFSGCTLTTIPIPNSVTTIGEGAFSGCTHLAEVTIPKSVTSIGKSAFAGCTNLTSIQVEQGNPSYDSRDNCNAIIETGTNSLVAGCKNTAILNSVSAIGKDAFRGAIGLKTIAIPNSVSTIEEMAFAECTGLTKVIIPNSITKIDTLTFSGCTALTSLVIPNSVTEIGFGAFLGCSGLTKIIIPNSVITIDEWAFTGCTGLTSVVIPNSVTTIGAVFNRCTGLTSVTIPNSVTEIGNSAFYGCSGLTNITIPNSVTTIGESAFSGCTSLTRVAISNSVTAICERAFSECAGLTSIALPNSVTTIGEWAFSECTGLTRVIFPNSVSSIGEFAFSGCTGLTQVTIPNSVTEIGSRAFSRCAGLNSVYSYIVNTEVFIDPYETIIEEVLDDGLYSGYEYGFIFENVPESCILYVPKGTTDRYRNNRQFENFTIFEMDD